MAQPAKTTPLTNIQREVWDLIKAQGPVAKINWSEMLTRLDHDRRKGYSTKRIHDAVVQMNKMTPCRMKLAQDTKDYGVALEAQ
ncbi:MAG: hypothetical protein WCA89_14420 [Terracidiphilus sp.]